jgi:uncharacterized protein YecA (UPF0149 family)
MGYVGEEDKFSTGRVVRVEMKAFFKSSSAALAGGEKEGVTTVLRLFLECFYIHHDIAPKEMDGTTFEKIALGTLARRFNGDESYLHLVPKVVRAYMHYLKKRTTLQDIAEIEETVASLEEKFSAAVKDVKKADRIPDEPPAEQLVKAAKVGRNDPCPCGSGKKYKKCCAAGEQN